MARLRELTPASTNEVFDEIECEVRSVRNWKIEGCHFWPFERLRLLMSIRARTLLTAALAPRPVGTAPRQGPSRAGRRQDGMPFFVESNGATLRDSEVVLLTEPSQYNGIYRGKRFSRFVDAFAENHGSADAQRICVGQIDRAHQPPVILDTARMPRVRSVSLTIDSLDPYNSILRDWGLAAFDPSDHFDRLVTIAMFLNAFKQYFASYTHHQAGVCCYYSLHGLCFIHAARQRGIPTFDIQHGQIGPNHPMYTSFRDARGYSNVPDMVRAWNQRTADFLERQGPPVTVTQNEWLTFRHRHDRDFPVLPKPVNKVLTIAMQQSVPLPEHLYAAVQKTDGEIEWVFRAHPMDEGNLALLERAIADRLSTANWRLTSACEVDLIGQLKASSALVSVASTAVEEAVACGVPVGLLVERFLFKYSDRLAIGSAVRCLTTSSLLSFARSVAVNHEAHPSLASNGAAGVG